MNIKSLLSTLIFVSVFVFSITLNAQESAAIQPGQSVGGEISADTPEQRWTFFGLRDQMISLVVEGQDDFDPVVTLRIADGNVVISNDDAIHGEVRDAVVEGLSLPATADYEVIITGYQGSTGEFQLQLLPGYADVIYQEQITDLADWQLEGIAASDSSDEALHLTLEGVAESSVLTNQATGDLDTAYVQVGVQSVAGPGGWTLGLLLRQSANGESYRVLVNSEGNWRAIALSGSDESRILRDWSPHPAIVPGESGFILAALVNGSVIEVFYNNQLLGRLADTTPLETGQVGIVITTPNSLTNDITVALADFQVTVPVLMDDASLLPQHLVRGNIAMSTQEIERRKLVPPGGRLLLNVGESFIENRNPGVERLFLGQGIQPGAFAMGTIATVEVFGTGTVGCGLVFHSVDDTSYAIAFVDSSGGYGLSERNGDSFSDGLYRTTGIGNVGIGIPILVTAVDGVLKLFVDNIYVGELESDYSPGEVGNVIINFDPVEARCGFRDTWLWTWEPSQ